MELNSYLCGDCLDLIPDLDDKSINLVVTSPPYADQRGDLYSGIPEDEFPSFIDSLFDSLRPKLRKDASILMVIRTHIRNGEISDYVLRTRMLLRQHAWKECEELIWFKSDAPPLGSIRRPRRVWENILWFSRTTDPYVDLQACGNPHSSRVGFDGSARFGDGVVVAKTESEEMKIGISRVSDVFTAKIAEIDKGVMHPAMYPRTLARQLIKTFSREGDIVLDPFAGSGTTLIEAFNLDRKYIGFEKQYDYILEFERRRMKIEGSDLFPVE